MVNSLQPSSGSSNMILQASWLWPTKLKATTNEGMEQHMLVILEFGEWLYRRLQPEEIIRIWNKITRSWTKWIWVEIRGLLPNMKQLFQGHIHIMSTLPEIPGCFFCTASAAVKVNQSGDISYQNLKVGKICLQCEAPRWCFWFVYKSSNYNSIPHKPTELYPQVSAHVSHKYWVAVAHIVHICKHYILKGMCMYIYIFVYIYIWLYLYIYTHRYTVAGRYNLSVLVVFSPLRIRLRRFDRFFLSQWHCKVICANRVSSSFLSFKMVKKKAS